MEKISIAPNGSNKYIYVFTCLDGSSIEEYLSALTNSYAWREGSLSQDDSTYDFLVVPPSGIASLQKKLRRPYIVIGLSKRTRLVDHVKCDLCVSANCSIRRFILVFSMYFHSLEFLDEGEYKIYSCSCGLPLHYHRLSEGNTKRHVQCANCGADFYLRVSKESEV